MDTHQHQRKFSKLASDHDRSLLFDLLSAKTPIGKNNDQQRISRKELYEMIRRQIEHEDGLVNQRLNWLLLSQAFLFAAFTSLLTLNISTSFKPNIDIKWIPFGITIAGMILSLLSFMSIRAAYKSLRNLRQIWYYPYKNEEERQKLKEGFPPITWVGRWYDNAIDIASGTPILIVLIWGSLAYIFAANRILGLIVFMIAVLLVLLMICFTAKS